MGGGGGWVGGGGGQGGCELRSEAFVKIQKKKIFRGGGVWVRGWGVGLGGQGGCEWRSEACEWGGGRVDVNGEVKLL